MPRSASQYVDDSCSTYRNIWAQLDICRTHGYAYVLTCPECGRRFHSIRANATTCSDRCRKRRARGTSSTSVTAAVTPQIDGHPVEVGQPVTPNESPPLTNDTGAAVTVTFHSTFATRLTSEQTQAIAAALAQNPTGDVLIRFIRPRRQE